MVGKERERERGWTWIVSNQWRVFTWAVSLKEKISRTHNLIAHVYTESMFLVRNDIRWSMGGWVAVRQEIHHTESKDSAILNLGVFFSSKNKLSSLPSFGFLHNQKKQSRRIKKNKTKQKKQLTKGGKGVSARVSVSATAPQVSITAQSEDILCLLLTYFAFRVELGVVETRAKNYTHK